MKDFDLLFNETINELKPIMADMDISIFSKHNHGYTRYKSTDILKGFINEKKRYKKTFNFIVESYKRPIKLLDIGTLIAILPIMLSKALVLIQA